MTVIFTGHFWDYNRYNLDFFKCFIIYYLLHSLYNENILKHLNSIQVPLPLRFWFYVFYFYFKSLSIWLFYRINILFQLPTYSHFYYTVTSFFLDFPCSAKHQIPYAWSNLFSSSFFSLIGLKKVKRKFTSVLLSGSAFICLPFSLYQSHFIVFCLLSFL